MVMVQSGSPGRGDQGSRGRGRGQVGRYRRGRGPGHRRGGRGRGSQNYQQQHPEGEQSHKQAKKVPAGGCFHCQGNHYVHKCPEPTLDQNSQLFIQTQEEEDGVNGGDDDNCDVDGEYHGGVCAFNLYEPPRDVEGFDCLVSLGQNQRGHARPVQDTLD